MEDLKQIMPKKLGFGCMRLPVANGNSEEIDDAVFCRMIDRYMEQGFVYFDTAYPYHNQKSEEAVRRCLVERYDRERFLLADKMPVWLVQNMEDYSEIFESQLARCGVTYFDFYLFHAMNKTRVEETEKTGGFAFVQRMKTEGRIRHIGFSFHDTAEALEEILKNHPEMEFVQLQINYYDWESENVQSRKCYEVAKKYGDRDGAGKGRNTRQHDRQTGRDLKGAFTGGELRFLHDPLRGVTGKCDAGVERYVG